MNWITAYLDAIEKELPAEGREDLATEIKTLLLERLEEETGRTAEEMSEAEALAWLKQQDHPALVAAGYGTRRSLVSEEAFPLFKLTLQYVFIGLFIAYALIAAVKSFHHPAAIIDHLFVALGSNLLQTGLTAFAVVTLIFHFFGDRLQAREKLADWEPSRLLGPREAWAQVARSSSIAALVTIVVGMLFLNGYFDRIADGNETDRARLLTPSFTAAAVALRPWINLILLGSAGVQCLLLAQRRWTAVSLAANLLLSLAAVVLCYQLSQITPLVEWDTQAVDGDNGLRRAEVWINTSLRAGLVILLLVNAWEAGRDGWRLVKIGRLRPRS